MTRANTHSIQTLLYWGTGIIMALVLTFFYANNQLDKEENELHLLQLDIALSSQQMLMMRRHEKDFLARQDNKYVAQMGDEAKAIKSRLITITDSMTGHALTTDFNNNNTLAAIDAYQDQFKHLTETVYLIYGNSQGTGSIDTLKQSTLDFERVAFTANDEQLTHQLIDLQSLLIAFFKNFDTTLSPQIDLALRDLQQRVNTHTDNLQLATQFTQFSDHYYQLKGYFETLGYDHNSGQLGKLRATIHSVESNLSSLYNIIPSLIQTKLANYMFYHNLLACLLGLSILAVLFFVIRSVSNLESALVTSREKETKANRAKSSFLANMSHEIRTPLNGIIGMTEILSDSKLSAIQKDYLITINSSSQTLLMLINDVLDLSKIESGHLEVNTHTCDIREIIYDTAALIAPKAQQKKVDLHINMDTNIPDYVRADEQKIRQVMMNLASNAIKFTQKGAVTFTLNRVNQIDDSIDFYFAVKDTGIGIDSSKHDQVFEEFKQESNSTSTTYGGTGLGLAISSKMIKMMGGNIEIASEKGQGCEFFFTIRLATDPETKAHKGEPKPIIYCTQKPNDLLTQNLETMGYPITLISSPDDISLNQNNRTASNQHYVLILDVPCFGSKVDTIHQQYPNLPILLARPNNADKLDYGALIAGYITLPLLGSRLDTLIKSAKPHDAETSDEASGSHELLTTDATPSSDKNGMVLVVEDNVVNQKVVSINLKKLGYHYEIANNGAEALEIFKQHHQKTALILMDCMMPIMDGFEATHQIRDFERQQQLSETHIIALTASILDDDIQRCFDSGMNDYLPKPFRREVLIEKLEKHAVCES
ncbi:ATP-binding protein [Photobacterium sanguinicancri]|uniref:ATP-binding protein n=1 Tax=Photobacterium sanguinicancri TaxID=875932 RepID=UPI0026E27614|nr:ATP-binding protein [Photobacterium sanguinicancri]MDO6499946.1 ATP-binding protein [Photobacterium sanguinicancri]